MTDTWRDRLQPASFRGVPFHVDRSSGSGGRRVAVHEYAGQSGYDTEDLGGKAVEQTLSAFLIGPDYDIARSELLRAIEAEGAGTLVHPHDGTMSVRITNYTWNISTRQGGFCRFDLRFVKESRRRPPAASNTAAALAAAAADTSAVAQAAFVEKFDVTGADAVSLSATDILGDALSALRTVNGRVNAQVAALQGVAADIDAIGNELSDLILAPATLISSAASVVSSLIGSYNSIKEAFNAYDRLLAGFRVGRPINRTAANGVETATRARMAENQAAISDALVVVAVVGMADLIASSAQPFESWEQAVSIRNALLDELSDKAAGTGITWDEYNALSRLQSALHQRIDEVAPGLQRIEQVQVQRSIPALVLAHKVYGDARRADELAARNGVNNPLFMPAGKNLEVLQ